VWIRPDARKTRAVPTIGCPSPYGVNIDKALGQTGVGQAGLRPKSSPCRGCTPRSPVARAAVGGATGNRLPETSRIQPTPPASRASGTEPTMGAPPPTELDARRRGRIRPAVSHARGRWFEPSRAHRPPARSGSGIAADRWARGVPFGFRFRTGRAQWDGIHPRGRAAPHYRRIPHQVGTRSGSLTIPWRIVLARRSGASRSAPSGI
jgi:hypothetical protein